MPKILITTSSFTIDLPEIRALENSGYEIVLNPHKRRLSEDEVAALLTPEIVGIIAGLEPLTASVIEGAQNLRVISRCGTGMDNVDLEAAKACGIAVFNTPDAPTKAVAELTIGLMLSCLRGISFQDRSMREGKWERPMGGLLGARTLGLIGYGRIGREVARYAFGFGTEILVYDPVLSSAPEGMKTVSLNELLAQSDIISLHVPLNDSTKNMIDAGTLAKMKPGAILINASRGGLVDEQAVYNALENGQLGGAGFDVFDQEPYDGPLTRTDKAVLTAHVGSYAKEARLQQEAEAAQNLLNALQQEKEQAYG